jgi:hypothetical protein
MSAKYVCACANPEDRNYGNIVNLKEQITSSISLSGGGKYRRRTNRFRRRRGGSGSTIKYRGNHRRVSSKKISRRRKYNITRG